MPLSEKDVQMWQDRLERSRRVLIHEGILESPGEEGTKLCRELVKMYSGDEASHFGDFVDWIDQDERVLVNKIFQAANQLEAEISSQRPDVQLLPRMGVGKREAVERAANAARAVQPLISWDIEELDMQSQHNDAMLDTLFYPIAWMRCGFTVDEVTTTDLRKAEGEQEKRNSPLRLERPQRPWLMRMPPWDVYPDPDARRFTPDGGMKWVAFRTVMTRDQIRVNDNMKATKEQLDELRGGIRHPEHPNGREQRNTPKDLDSPDAEDLIEVYTFYDAMTRTWFQMHEDGHVFREPAAWPIEWEWLPVRALVMNPRRQSPWGVPILSTAGPIQKEINHVRTMMSWLARTIRRLVAIRTDSLEDGEDRKLETAHLTEIIKFKASLADAIQVVQSGGFPQELVQYVLMLEEDLRESIGISRLGRGQRINVETATEAAGVQGGQDVHMGRFATKFERFWKDNLTMYMQARRQSFDPEGTEVVPLLGPDVEEALRWSEVSAEEMQFDLDFVIVPGSTRRRSRLEEEQRAMAAVLLANEHPDIFNLAYYAARLAQVQGVDPSEALQSFADTAGALRGVREVANQANPGLPEAGGQGGTANPAALALAFPQGGGGQG